MRKSSAIPSKLMGVSEMSLIDDNNLTINDIAQQLEISKTTVSRAISGKGRVSPQTRQRVLDYVSQHGYRPSASTSRFLKAKTGNIGIVLPSDPNIVDTPFFLGCLVGICETASFNGYNVIVVTEVSNSAGYLSDLVTNHKVDGIILTRALTEESQPQFLQANKMPFVLIGSSKEPGVIQVDNNVFGSCTELTKILFNGNERLALLCGDQSHRAHKVRYEGYLQAFIDCERPVDKSRIFLNMNNKAVIEQAMSQLMDIGVDCIIASDDVICGRALNWLHNRKYKIPEDVKIASFYNSNNLAEHNPPVTAISISPKEMGSKAMKVLLQMLDGQNVRQQNLVNYEILLRRSTM